MKDTEIADGSRCVLDANVLIYAEEGHSKQASALLARCAEGAVSGVIPFAALLEVCHKLMLIEARARNKISGSNPARKLSDQPEVVITLHQYRAKVDALLDMGMRVEEHRLADYARAVELQSAYGLLTIDSVILATDGVRFKTTLQHRDVIDLGYTEIAVGYWDDIGVDVTIEIIDTAALIANRTDASYEMITGDLAFLLDPAIGVGFYRPNQHVYALTGGVQTPELTAASDAFFAATTVEERKKAAIEFDMAIVRQHNQIWGPLAPQLQASQPWLKGFNGEVGIGSIAGHPLMARLWIDQDLKREMGF